MERISVKLTRPVVWRSRTRGEVSDEESKTTVIHFILADCEWAGIRAATPEGHHQSGLFGARRQQYANPVDLDSISSSGCAGHNRRQRESMAR